MNHLNKLIIASAVAIIASGTTYAERRFYLPMESRYGQITEQVSGTRYNVTGVNGDEKVPGSKGNSVRLDGYSTYISGNVDLGELPAMTFSLWCAMETWPIIEHDVHNETDMACIAGNYDSGANTGFGFFVGRTGRLSFKYFSGGWPGEVVCNGTLPLYKWNNLVAVADGSKVTIYNNGTQIGQGNARNLSATGTMIIGKSKEERKMGPFHLNTVNGIVDEIEIYNEALPLSTIQGWRAENDVQLGIVGESRYEDDLWHPAFHGMPARNWTNESHGLIHYNGKYHVFFQKNANGPYMSRLQWGHIVSENLYDWEELPIAIGSDHWYDTKGCWSGCIAMDGVVTGNKPNIIYTGVDYGRAMIGKATPLDNDLISWSKPENPIIDGRPQGLSDDFRDPYFFTNGNDAYIIVGSAKDGRGVCTLHKYVPSSKTWTNDGKIFFQAQNAGTQGGFWEMPNLTKIGDKHLFTATPLGLNGGVRTLYWTGSINSDGTFNSSSAPLSVDFSGFAKEGYGLLSPSITNHDGKTIAFGIVPDKLPGEENYRMGWAHTYSLPREWSLNASGQLVQKPYSGLTGLRASSLYSADSKSISGSEKMGDIKDRMIEVIGEFTVDNGTFGFSFFKSGTKAAKLYYTPSNGKLTLDMRSLERVSNDNGVFNGLYETSLPSPIAKGSVMKIHVFIDHSIMDIFVNDTWATSVRLFPTNASANAVEVFSNGGATTANVRAWNLATKQSGVEYVECDFSDKENAHANVYDCRGVCIRANVEKDEALNGLPAGLYIVNGKKFLVK